MARELPSQKHINVVLNLFLKDHVCDQLPWEPPWACLDFLGVSRGLLRPPGCLLWQSLGKNLFPHAHPPQQTSLCNHVWSARAKHAIYEKHPGLDEKHIQVDMDLACDPDKTAFAISSLIHGPDLLLGKAGAGLVWNERARRR